MHQLGCNVWCFPFSEHTDRPNLGYIRGERFALMVDGGNSPAHVEEFLSELEAMGLPEPDLVAVTHWHWDHTYGLCALNCPVIAGRETARELEKMSTWRFDLSSMEARLRFGEEILFCHENILKEYEEPEKIQVRRADIILDGSAEIDLGGTLCRLFPVGGPHSRDSTAVYLPQEKIIFLGDSTAEEFYDGPPHYEKDRLVPYIELLKGISFDIAVPGHGGPEQKQELIAYLEQELKRL